LVPIVCMCICVQNELVWGLIEKTAEWFAWVVWAWTKDPEKLLFFVESNVACRFFFLWKYLDGLISKITQNYLITGSMGESRVI
jgi:hypothetical protein